jgi:hypothetical protein
VKFNQKQIEEVIATHEAAGKVIAAFERGELAPWKYEVEAAFRIRLTFNGEVKQMLLGLDEGVRQVVVRGLLRQAYDKAITANEIDFNEMADAISDEVIDTFVDLHLSETTHSLTAGV